MCSFTLYDSRCHVVGESWKVFKKNTPVLAPDKSIKTKPHSWGLEDIFYLGTSHSSCTHTKLRPSPAKYTWRQEKNLMHQNQRLLGVSVQRSKSCWSYWEFLSSLCFPGAVLPRKAAPCLTCLFFWALFQSLTHISPPDKFICAETRCRPEESQGLVYVYHT